ncbi:MAG TPA: trigger factor [Candidatus Acidoferrales bacterium]|jgi:trigger factor|nr:trigger factor [Candidatus Acidoferrales bacterium]
MSEAEATCRRELELEIPAEEVAKTSEKIAKEIARVARVPGFRPGKAPVTLIRRRFAEDIKSEVMQQLLPARIEQAVTKEKLVPVTQPQVDKVDYAEGGPLKFRASFEVLPTFELAPYKDVEVEVEAPDLSDADVDKTLEEMRERAATYVPVEGRALADGDFAQLKLTGNPQGGGEPLRAENVMCNIGSENTLDAFNENLRGAQAGEQRRFDLTYPADYPDPKLAGKSYHYIADITAVKEKKLPELNDEFAKDVSEAASLDELRGKIREGLEAARENQMADQTRDKLLAKIVNANDFPVPQALVEHQMDARLERAVRSLAAQGVDPRAVNVDWVAMRRKQRDRAVEDVKAELILDKIATAENIEASEEELEKQLAAIAEHGGESATVVRARLTKQGALDRMKSKLRSDKTLEWLRQHARIQVSKQSTEKK